MPAVGAHSICARKRKEITMKFRRILLILAILLLAIPPVVANADVLYEPRNDFFGSFSEYCVPLQRQFVASGSVGIKQNPGDRNDIATLKNGETAYIQYSCLVNGNYWGMATNIATAADYIDGWVNLGEMLVVYDDFSFEEDFGDEFYQYEGDYAEVFEADELILWAWPGSGIVITTFEDVDDQFMSVEHTYRDADGREWGHLTYYFGFRSVWICLDDPANGSIPAFNPDPGPAVWQPDTEHREVTYSGGAGNSNLLIIIGVMIAALVVITLVLIKVLYKPKKSEAMEGVEKTEQNEH